MQRGDTVRAVRTDDRQIGHANLLRCAFLDEAYPLLALNITGEAAVEIEHQAAIDFVDDVQVPWKRDIEPFQWPLFESFGQKRMIRISQGPDGQIPGLFPRK